VIKAEESSREASVIDQLAHLPVAKTETGRGKSIARPEEPPPGAHSSPCAGEQETIAFKMKTPCSGGGGAASVSAAMSLD